MTTAKDFARSPLSRAKLSIVSAPGMPYSRSLLYVPLNMRQLTFWDLSVIALVPKPWK
jgi:hypothetical protein